MKDSNLQSYLKDIKTIRSSNKKIEVVWYENWTDNYLLKLNIKDSNILFQYLIKEFSIFCFGGNYIYDNGCLVFEINNGLYFEDSDECYYYIMSILKNKYKCQVV